MRGYRPPADKEICGETYDHEIDPRDYDEIPEGPWTCLRCDGEIWPEEGN